MSTNPAEPRPQRRILVCCAALSLLVGLLLAGCTDDGRSDLPPSGESTGAEVATQISRVLRQRSRAIRAGDRESFLATVDRRSPGFVRREGVFFANMLQLPLARLGYRLDEASLVRRDDGYDAVVQVKLQLEGYDEVPVVRPKRFHFTRADGGGGLLVASHRDRAWEQRHGIDIQPWDSGAITVRSGLGVLAIFDEESARRSTEVIGAVEDGIGHVRDLIPYDWSGQVVVYALSDTAMLEQLDDLPATDPGSLDAVAFAVPARDKEPGGELAGMRFLLHPRMLDSHPAQLARLIRHELTHVALGRRDDAVPMWLGEGVAEWVSVQALPAEQRLISREAIDLARQGLGRLPEDVEFHGQDQAANYGISWWACEALVDIYGEQMLWRLLDELATTDPADQHERLQETLQMSAGQLAREASRRIVATYD